MLLKCLIPFFFAGVSLAQDLMNITRCGNGPVPPGVINTAKRLAKLEQVREDLGFGVHHSTSKPTIMVDLHMHYVSHWSNLKVMVSLLISLHIKHRQDQVQLNNYD
jgi:hypothetical protein